MEEITSGCSTFATQVPRQLPRPAAFASLTECTARTARRVIGSSYDMADRPQLAL